MPFTWNYQTDMKPDLIQRQIFELSTTSAKANAWDASASRFQQEVILLVLEECFQKFSTPDQHIIIDRIEIDLGVFSSELFFKQGRDRLVALLQQELQKIKVQHTAENSTGPDNKNSPTQQLLQADPITEIKKDKRWIIDSSKATYLCFVSFLQLGRFPWWYQTAATERMEDQFTLEWMHSFNDLEKNELKNIITTSPPAQIRIANHFKAEWLGEFLQALGLAGWEGRKQWKLFSAAAVKFPAIRTRLHQNFWISWIVTRKSLRASPDVKLIFEQTLQGHRPVVSDLFETLQNTCLENIKDPDLAHSSTIILKELANLYTIQEENTQDRPVKMKTDTIGKSDTSNTGQFSNEQILDFVRTTPQHTTPTKNAGNTSDEKEEASLYVAGAGMVLVHPFLSELFTSLGLWQDTHWSSDESCFKAVQLLSFLCYGDASVPEHQLVFLKIVSGIAADAPVPAQQPITIKEISACVELLTAIIQHWKALRSTSPDGLREVFLQRPGKLTPIENGQMLIVERKTQDVLLSHLPWGYSLIKLPWMEQLIHVSWI